MEPYSGRILVVDDQEMNRDLLTRRFRKKGYEVDEAGGGEQAIAMVEGGNYDVILLDIMMPGVDGLQVLKAIRRTRNMAELPVIMITAKTGNESVIEALDLGANDYITKPVEFPVALARVRTQVQLTSLQKALVREREWISEVFGKYVATEVRDEVLSDRVSLDGEIKDVTVLFADLRDFTPLNEVHDPKIVVRLLNRYFAEMSAAVQGEGGLVLQFLGDEIYAVFGAPAPVADHASKAVNAAMKMGEALRSLNVSLEAEGLPRLRHAIGMHSGPVVAASLGSPERRTYLLVGDTVNLASRLQRVAAESGREIVLSATTCNLLSEELQGMACLEKLPPAQVKGKEEPVAVFAARS